MVTREMAEKLSHRKQLLFACHCCREIWDLLTDERSRRAVELVECHIEQSVSKEELATAYYAANSATASAANSAAASAVNATASAANAADHAAYAAVYAAYASARSIMRQKQLEIYNEIHFKDTWVGWVHYHLAPVIDHREVNILAKTIYYEQDWKLTPILADLLEDVGCSWHLMLAHLRDGVTHRRGCWAIDMLLKKE